MAQPFGKLTRKPRGQSVAGSIPSAASERTGTQIGEPVRPRTLTVELAGLGDQLRPAAGPMQRKPASAERPAVYGLTGTLSYGDRRWNGQAPHARRDRRPGSTEARARSSQCVCMGGARPKSDQQAVRAAGSAHWCPGGERVAQSNWGGGCGRRPGNPCRVGGKGSHRWWNRNRRYGSRQGLRKERGPENGESRAREAAC